MTVAPRDDRVLPATRALAVVLVPILLTAFVILYGFPADTGRLFAWTIRPDLTPMVLASAYLGGAWFFVRVVRRAAMGDGSAQGWSPSPSSRPCSASPR